MSYDDIADPDWMHAVSADVSGSILEMIGRLRISATPEHFLYREAELDDLFRHLEMEGRRAERRGVDRAAELLTLTALAFDAHDHVAGGAAAEAAVILGNVQERWSSSVEQSDGR